MGLRGLLGYLITHLKETSYSKLKPGTVGIDGNNFAHHCLDRQAILELHFVNDTSRILDKLEFTCKELTKNNVQPIVVFDGACVNDKNYDIPGNTGRHNTPFSKDLEEAVDYALFHEMKKNMSSAFTRYHRVKLQVLDATYALMPTESTEHIPEEIMERRVRILWQKIAITKNTIDHLINRLSITVPRIRAPAEADDQLIYMQKCGIIKYIMSYDADFVTAGCNNLILYRLSGKIYYLDSKDKDFDLRYLSACVRYMQAIMECGSLVPEGNIPAEVAYKIAKKCKESRDVFPKLLSFYNITREGIQARRQGPVIPDIVTSVANIPEKPNSLSYSCRWKACTIRKLENSINVSLSRVNTLIVLDPFQNCVTKVLIDSSGEVKELKGLTRDEVHKIAKYRGKNGGYVRYIDSTSDTIQRFITQNG